MLPSLQSTERQRIAEAARLANSGVPVKWRALGMRLVYLVNGREHFILSAGSRRIFDALCRQAEAFYREAHAQANGVPQAVEASKETPAGKTETRAFAEPAVHGLAEDSRALCGVSGDGSGAAGGCL